MCVCVCVCIVDREKRQKKGISVVVLVGRPAEIRDGSPPEENIAGAYFASILFSVLGINTETKESTLSLISASVCVCVCVCVSEKSIQKSEAGEGGRGTQVTSHSEDLERAVVTNGDPVGLRGAPLDLVDLALGRRVRQDGVLDGARHLLDVPYQRLVVVACPRSRRRSIAEEQNDNKTK